MGKQSIENGDPVPLPTAAIAVLEDAQRKMAEINAQMNTYVAGLRQGMGIPEDWKYDMKEKAFVPPEKKTE